MKAYQAMYQWYTKVLKVNLTTDYYEIIRSEDIEMESARSRVRRAKGNLKIKMMTFLETNGRSDF